MTRTEARKELRARLLAGMTVNVRQPEGERLLDYVDVIAEADLEEVGHALRNLHAGKAGAFLELFRALNRTLDDAADEYADAYLAGIEQMREAS